MKNKIKLKMRIVEYRTGDRVPENAVYMSSLVTQEYKEFPQVRHYFILHEMKSAGKNY